MNFFKIAFHLFGRNITPPEVKTGSIPICAGLREKVDRLHQKILENVDLEAPLITESFSMDDWRRLNSNPETAISIISEIARDLKRLEMHDHGRALGIASERLIDILDPPLELHSPLRLKDASSHESAITTISEIARDLEKSGMRDHANALRAASERLVDTFDPPTEPRPPLRREYDSSMLNRARITGLVGLPLEHLKR